MTLVTLVFHLSHSFIGRPEVGGGCSFSPHAVLPSFSSGIYSSLGEREREREIKCVCVCLCREGEVATSKTTTSVYDVTLRSSVGRSVCSTCVVHLAVVVAISLIEFFK
jgi:hypothetical protein